MWRQQDLRWRRRSRKGNAFLVSVLHHPADSEAAGALLVHLADAGVDVAGASGQDVQVVLLSRAALADPQWLRSVHRGGHVVVVRLERVALSQVGGPLDEKNQQTLDWLFRMNQIEWRPGSSGSDDGFGAVLAGIAFDLSDYTLERQLADAVRAWQDNLADDERLIDDHQFARSMRDLLQDYRTDQWGLQPWAVQQFVEASLRKARRRTRRRLFWTAGSVMAAALLAVTASVLAPLLTQRGLDNHATVATANDPAIMVEVPEWSAAQAASLLLHGSDAQRELARQTLRETLNRPWRIGSIATYPDVSSFVLVDHGTRGAVIYRDGTTSSFAMLAMPAGDVLWTQPLPAVYLDISVSSDGAMALAVGSTGAATVELRSREVRHLDDIRLRFARLVTADTAVAVSFDNSLVRLNVRDGKATTLATFADVADLRIVDTGRAVALAETSDQQVVLVDAETGTQVVTVPSDLLRIRGGGVSPDGRGAILPGTDGQFWTIGVGTRPQPTGIAVPYLPRAVLWATGDRAVVLSDDRRGEVFYLPDAVPLGTVCRDIVRPIGIRGYEASDLVSCASDGLHSVWRLPDAPLPTPLEGESWLPSATMGGLSVTANGREVTISAPTFTTDTTIGGFKGQVTAVALDTDGSHIVVGDSWGYVAVIQRGPNSWEIVSSWKVPNAAVVTAVGWVDGPVATTTTGQTWRVPDCGACASDEDLITAFRARFSGCLTERQLSYIDGATRENLGIHVCATLGAG